MRKLTCILLVLLLILPGCGKKAEEPQFICTACRQEFLNSGVVTDTDEEFCTYNGQGLIMSSERYHNGVLSFRSVWEYDEFGNLIRVTEEKDGAVTTGNYNNILDEKGHPLRQEIWIGDTMTSFDEYTYDRNGNTVRHHTNLWYDDQSEAEWRTYTMNYDWMGNLIRKELHWNFNDEYIIWEYEDGHCIRQISYQEGTGRITETLENTYDKKGNHTGKNYHNPVTDKISEFWEYTYELLDTTPET